MNKAYSKTTWKNYPSVDSPINEQNLNNIENGVDEIDNRVITLDNTKATKLEVSELFSNVSFDDQAGIITFTRKNGATVTIDTPMEKIALNIYYDPITEMLTLPLVDGTQMQVDLSRLITEYEFVDSDTIAFSVGVDGKVTAIVKEGSIEEKHLRPDYLADIKVESAKAEASAKESASHAKDSSDSAKLSESWAVGGTGTREGEDADNSKHYSEISKQWSDTSKEYADSAEDTLDQISKKIEMAEFSIDDDGNLIYTDVGSYDFFIDDNGMLNYSYSAVAQGGYI